MICKGPVALLLVFAYYVHSITALDAFQWSKRGPTTDSSIGPLTNGLRSTGRATAFDTAVTVADAGIPIGGGGGTSYSSPAQLAGGKYPELPEHVYSAGSVSVGDGRSTPYKKYRAKKKNSSSKNATSTSKGHTHHESHEDGIDVDPGSGSGGASGTIEPPSEGDGSSGAVGAPGEGDAAGQHKQGKAGSSGRDGDSSAPGEAENARMGPALDPGQLESKGDSAADSSGHHRIAGDSGGEHGKKAEQSAPGKAEAGATGLQADDGMTGMDGMSGTRGGMMQ